MLTTISKYRFSILFFALFVCISGSVLTIIYSPLNSLTVEVQSPSYSDTYQLFYDIGNGFNESQSVKAFVENNRGVVKVIFKIPLGKIIRNIRIDPGTQPGTIVINRVTLNCSFYSIYNKELYNWSAGEIASSFLPVNHISEFEVNNGSLRVTPTGNDPGFTSNFDFQGIYTDITFKRTAFIKDLFFAFIFSLPIVCIVFFYIKKHKVVLKEFAKNRLLLLVGYLQYKHMPVVIYLTLLVVLIINIYIPHIKDYFFLFDDYVLVHASINNSIKTIFTSTNYLGFYRPLITFLMKLESNMWQFNNPHGYILVTIILHVINSILLIYLMKELKFKINQCFFAASIFLVSPWSSETFFWLSCRFDITATLFIMLTLIYSFRSLNNIRLYDYLIVFALSFLAYSSKEIAVTLPFTFILFGIRASGIQGLRNSPLLKLFVFQLLSLFVYFIIRGKYLGVLGGAYGSYFDIVNISNFVVNPFLSLNNYILEPIAPNNYLPHLAFLFSLFLIVYHSLLCNFKMVAFLLMVYYVAIAPALFSIPNGRLIYYPSIYICIILGMGMVSCFTKLLEDISVKKTQYITITLCVMMFYYMYDYINYQRKIWSEASFLAKESIVQVNDYLKISKKIYIANLPILFVEGQYILKSYAFRLYYQDAEISVRSDGIFLKYDNGNNAVVLRQEDAFSQHEVAKDELYITLKLPSLVY